MKKFTKLTLITAICLISVGMVISAIGLFSGASYGEALRSGMWNTMFYAKDDYANEFSKDGSYHFEAASGEFSDIAIDWLSGDITVETYGGKEVQIMENSKDELDEDSCLRYTIEEDMLKITSSRDAAGISFSSDEKIQSKQLTVRIPRKVAERIDWINIDAQDSNVSIRDFHVKQLNVYLAYGDFTGKNLKANKAEIDLIKGSCKVDFLSCPNDFYYAASTGDCWLGLPEGSNAQVTFDTDDGEVYNGFGKGHVHGKEFGEGQLKIGKGGENALHMYTIIGDLKISKGSCFK